MKCKILSFIPLIKFLFIYSKKIDKHSGPELIEELPLFAFQI